MTSRKDGAAPFDLLPAIDLRGGRVVRLLRGDFARETVFGDDPVAIATRFVDEGARWLHVVDLDGARDPAARQLDVVGAIVARVGERASVEVAGGLRDRGSCRRTSCDRAPPAPSSARPPSRIRRSPDGWWQAREPIASPSLSTSADGLPSGMAGAPEHPGRRWRRRSGAWPTPG